VKTLEDWKDAYYEQQALHTEATGMLGQERDHWKKRAEEAESRLSKGTQDAKDIAIEYYESECDDSGCHAVSMCTSAVQVVQCLVRDLAAADAMAVSAGADAERAIRHAEKVEGDLESATQPLAGEMERLNQRVIALNAENMRLKANLPYAEELRGHLEWALDLVTDWVPADRYEWQDFRRARAALAKNPNPSGRITAEPSAAKAGPSEMTGLSTEDSGPVGLGPCADCGAAAGMGHAASCPEWREPNAPVTERKVGGNDAKRS